MSLNLSLSSVKAWRYNSHCVKSVQIRSFFWSVFSRIRAEYGEILCIPPYSVRMRENTAQKKLLIWALFTQCLNLSLSSVKAWRYNRHCVKSVQIRSFFWSVFSRIRAEYGEILCIPPYSVRMRENTAQKKLLIWALFTQ